MADEPTATSNGSDADADETGTPQDKQDDPEQKPAASAAGRSIGTVIVADRLSRLAGSIAADVKAKAGDRGIVVVEDRSVAESSLVLREVESVLQTVGDLLAAIDTMVAAAPLPPPTPEREETAGQPPTDGSGGDRALAGGIPGEAGAGAAGGQGGAASISVLDSLTHVTDALKLFATTIEVTPQDVAVDRTAVMAAVASRLGATVRWPATAAISAAPILADARAISTHLLATTASVDALAAAWSTQVADVERLKGRADALVHRRDDAITAGDQAAADRLDTAARREDRRLRIAAGADLARATAIVATARAALVNIGTRLAAIGTSGPTGLTGLQAAAVRQHVEEVAGPGTDFATLWIDVTAMGADRMRRSSALGWGSEVGYLGAGQVTYLLIAKDGQVLAGDAKTAYGFRIFDFTTFFESADSSSPWRPPRLINIEVVEILAVIFILVVVLLIVQALFS